MRLQLYWNILLLLLQLHSCEYLTVSSWVTISRRFLFPLLVVCSWQRIVWRTLSFPGFVFLFHWVSCHRKMTKMTKSKRRIGTKKKTKSCLKLRSHEDISFLVSENVSKKWNDLEIKWIPMMLLYDSMPVTQRGCHWLSKELPACTDFYVKHDSNVVKCSLEGRCRGQQQRNQRRCHSYQMKK